MPQCFQLILKPVRNSRPHLLHVVESQLVRQEMGNVPSNGREHDRCPNLRLHSRGLRKIDVSVEGILHHALCRLYSRKEEPLLPVLGSPATRNKRFNALFRHERKLLLFTSNESGLRTSGESPDRSHAVPAIDRLTVTYKGRSL